MSLKPGVWRVTWVVNPKTDDEVKMSELVYEVGNGDEAIAKIKARYTQGEIIKVTGVTQLR